MKNLFAPAKTINLELVGLDGNAFSLMGAFQKQAKREGWTPDEIQLVLDECRSSDYDHLLQVLITHTEVNDDQEEDDVWLDEDYL